MQITIVPSKYEMENKRQSSCYSNVKNPTFSYSIIDQLPKLFKSGYRKNDIIILVHARDSISKVQSLLKNADFDKFSFSIMTYHYFAERILKDFGFLANKQRFRTIGRQEQVKIIKKICNSQKDLINYKDISLFIIKNKCNFSNNSEEMKFSFLIKSKSSQNDFIHKIKLSENECDNYASKIFNIYQSTLDNKKYVDQEDLINFAFQIMKRNPEVISFYNRRYKFAFIDNTNKFLFKKINIDKFISLLFINNEDEYHLSIGNSQNNTNFGHECNKFRIFTLNTIPSFSCFSNVHNILTQSPFDSFENSVECKNNCKKIFQSSSEVSDFDFENDGGFNIDISSSNLSTNRHQCENDILSQNPSKFERNHHLLEFEEEDEIDSISDIDDFESETESESGDSFYIDKNNGSNNFSPRLIKNKFGLVNSMKTTKYLKNNFSFSNRPIIYNEIEAKRKDRRYSYYGQSHFLKEIDNHYFIFGNQKGKTAFFSDDNYE